LAQAVTASFKGASSAAEVYLNFAAAYATDDIVEDIQKYAAALNTEGWVLTKQEGTWEKGSFTVGKQSKDAGKILLLTVEMKGASFQVNTAKMEGTLNIDK
jgi:hypothetical protein